MKIKISYKDGSSKEIVIKDVVVNKMPDDGKAPITFHINGELDRGLLLVSSNVVSDISQLDKLEMVE